MASDEVEVQFSGNLNTMVAIALVAAALSLSLSVWCLSRIGDLEAFVAVQAIRSVQQQQGD